MSLNCNACAELREDSADFATNGVTSAVCESLGNDTGFNENSGNDDCTDLQTANDCLIGALFDDIEDTEVCDWKVYMSNLIPNLYQMFNAYNCVICGMWTMLHDHEERITKLEEIVADHEKRITKLEEIAEDHEERITTLENQMTDIQERVATLETSLTTLTKRVTIIENEITELWETINNINTEIENISSSINETTTNITELGDDITDILEELTSLKKSVATNTTNITSLQKEITKIYCIEDYLSSTGVTLSLGEATSGSAYAVAGKGVSFLTDSGATASDLKLVYIAGGLMKGTGSFNFYNDGFTDNKTVGNFDKGTEYRTSTSRKGNSYWGKTGRYANGGELICEFRIKLSAYPQISKIYSGFGQETGGGAYHVRLKVFTAGEYAYGQHGWCKSSNGNALEDGYDDGHLVPSGWVYIQMRMTYCTSMPIDSSAGYSQYSPGYFIGIRMEADEFDC